MIDSAPVLQRCNQFVGRTTNWLYDHLCFVPRYRPVVLCNTLVNRDEFPRLEAWCLNQAGLSARAWTRLMGGCPHPTLWLRLKRLAPRLLHSHFGNQAVADLGLHSSLRVPWAIAFYGADAYELGRLGEWRDLYGRCFEQCARVFALGPVMKEQIASMGCDPSKIKVHALGVDSDDLPASPRVLRPGDTLQVLFAGTFREKKGVEYALDAISIVHRRGVRIYFHLVGDAAGKPGDSELKDAIFRQIRQLGVENLVRHYSYLPFRELVALALRSHIFVAPSVRAASGDAEGTPFVLQQMMATEMPAISTVHSDIPYIFGDHASLLVPERNSRAIADRIHHYAENPEAIVRDGRALRDQIRNSFNVRKCAEHLADLYDEILQGH